MCCILHSPSYQWYPILWCKCTLLLEGMGMKNSQCSFIDIFLHPACAMLSHEYIIHNMDDILLACSERELQSLNDNNMTSFFLQLVYRLTKINSDTAVIYIYIHIYIYTGLCSTLLCISRKIFIYQKDLLMIFKTCWKTLIGYIPPTWNYQLWAQHIFGRDSTLERPMQLMIKLQRNWIF